MLEETVQCIQQNPNIPKSQPRLVHISAWFKPHDFHQYLQFLIAMECTLYSNQIHFVPNTASLLSILNNKHIGVTFLSPHPISLPSKVPTKLPLPSCKQSGMQCPFQQVEAAEATSTLVS